jgi:hypothetical protein
MVEHNPVQLKHASNSNLNQSHRIFEVCAVEPDVIFEGCLVEPSGALKARL